MRCFSSRLSLPALFMALCLFAGSANAATTITVNSLLDSGPNTLRAAINTANSTNDDVKIDFGSTGTGTITLATSLPPLNNSFGFSITIDGFTALGAARNTSDTDWNGSVTVQIDCNALGGQAAALKLDSANNKVFGLNFRKGDVAIEINGTGCAVEGCIIGCTTDLLTADGNATGIKITSANNTIGGTAAGQRNVISGNTEGLLITGASANGNAVKNNWFGIGYFNATYSAVPNTIGIRINNGAFNNFIGGPLAGDRNIISGNSNDGVKIEGVGTSNNGVFGNYIGINAIGGNFGNTNHGVSILNGATNNFVGGITLGNRNVIVNSTAGVVISGAGTDGNHVEANYIGLSSDGTTAKQNDVGVWIQLGAKLNIIGGDTSASRNVISGNAIHGIYISDQDTDLNRVIGNYIGLDAFGVMPQGNGEGVVIDLGANGNEIGGSTALGGGRSEGNVISANFNAGVRISGALTDGNTVQGNFIGVTEDGMFGLGNGGDGLVIDTGAAGNSIGGTAAGTGNVISGNSYDGIFILGASNTVIVGNLIGTDKTGTTAVPNTYSGVNISDGGQTQVGGANAAARNIISGNNNEGVYMDGASATGNVVSGNNIGVNINGAALGNLGYGIRIQNQASNNTVDKNIIAYNNIGVLIGNTEDTNPIFGNSILANSIYSNTNLGIDLIENGGSDGLTLNDLGDVDTAGGNNLQNFPVLTLAMVGSNGNLYVTGTLDSALPASTVQFFLSDDNASGYGQGKKFLLGSGGVSPGAFSATGSTGGVALKLGDSITATATTTDGTSEFSLNFAVSANTPPTADAGTSQLVSSGALITLDGSASSDPDALPLAAAIQDGNFFWSQTGGPAVTLNNPNSATPSFTPLVGGTYVFSLTVSDGLDNSTAASVTIQVNGRPVITSVTGTTPVRAGATITFTATYSDPENDPLTVSWSFGDGSTAGTNPADKIFTNVADMSYTVMVTVSDAVGSAQASFNVQVFAPNSGGAGSTNISTGKPPVDNPLNGLTIGVVASDGGVIEFLINVDALNRAAFDVSTDFDGIAGRVSTRTGTKVTEKFTEPEIYIATTKAVDSTTKEEKGKARKTVAVGRKETGKPPKIKNRSVDTTVQKPKIKGNFFFGRGATGAATLPKPDKVTLSAQIELPEGLDITQNQDFSIAIGNIVDTIMVDPKGKGLTPSTLGRIIKFKLKYPRLAKGTTETPAGSIAKFTMTVSGTDLSGQGFDTEGVAAGARDLDSKNSAPRDIQIVLMMGGEPYETSAPVNFKQNKSGEAGTIISGRGAQ